MTAIFGPSAVLVLVFLIAGLVLLVVELFVPGFGVSGILGILLLAAADFTLFSTGYKQAAFTVLAIVLLVIVLSLILFIRSLNRGRLSRSFLVLNEKIQSSSDPTLDAQTDLLVGQSGTALTQLRPSGIAEIGGKRYDVITDATFLEKGTPVTVIEAKGMHILVRKAEDPVEVL